MEKQNNSSSELHTGLEKFRDYIQSSVDVEGIHGAIVGFLESPRDVVQEEKIDKIMEVFKDFPLYSDHVKIIAIHKKIMLSQKNLERALGYQESLYRFVEQLKKNLSS